VQVVAEDMDPGCLSRGEARRVGLALTLGYHKLLEARGACIVDTLILDEPHTNLDSEGVRGMMGVLRALGKRSVVVVAQAGSEVEGRADHRVAVVKRSASDVVLEQF
jgi:DNA repair exonuclease SbcCD ATPase subunit